MNCIPMYGHNLHHTHIISNITQYEWQQSMNVVGSQYKISAPDVTKPSPDSQTDRQRQEKVEERIKCKVMEKATDISCRGDREEAPYR